MNPTRIAKDTTRPQIIPLAGRYDSIGGESDSSLMDELGVGSIVVRSGVEVGRGVGIFVGVGEGFISGTSSNVTCISYSII